MTISRRGDFVHAVDLAGHTLIGEPFPIPSTLAGLRYQALEDMTALAGAISASPDHAALDAVDLDAGWP